MRKWCPEFLTDPAVPASVAAEFSSEPTAFAGDGASGEFHKDPDLGRRHSLWEIMSPAERDQVLDRARVDLRAEFQDVIEEMHRAHREERDEDRAAYDARLDIWSREIEQHHHRDIEARAVEAAGLAVVLARKIIRDAVEVDRGVLIRTIETALFKLKEDRPLAVIVHPDDAELLSGDAGLRSRLNIEQVIADRRIEKGGCLVRAGDREWDATVSGQMDALLSVVEETLAAESRQGTGGGEAHTGGGHADLPD